MRVLVLTHHFYPEHVIGIYRPKGYFDYLPKHGISTDLMTFHYQIDSKRNFRIYPDKKVQFYLEKDQDRTIFRVVRKRSLAKRCFDALDTVSVLRKLKILVLFLSGHILKANHSYDSYRSFKRSLYSVLGSGAYHYDAIIAINFPEYHLRLAFEVKKRFGVEFVVDFKDFLWDYRLSGSSFKFTRGEQLLNKIALRYYRKWLSTARLVTSSSQEWKESLEKLFPKTEITVVSNGYDDVNGPSEVRKFPQFTIGYSGGLKDFQQIELFLQGLSLLDASVDYKLVFLGTSRVPKLDKAIRQLGIGDQIEFRAGVSKEEAQKFARKCHLLWFPCSPDTPGWIADKIYDYIFSGNPIMLSPGDGGVMERIVKESATGVVLDSSQEVKSYVEQQIIFWNEYEYLELDHSKRDLSPFTRPFQVTKMAEKLKRSLNHNE